MIPFFDGRAPPGRARPLPSSARVSASVETGTTRASRSGGTSGARATRIERRPQWTDLPGERRRLRALFHTSS